MIGTVLSLGQTILGITNQLSDGKDQKILDAVKTVDVTKGLYDSMTTNSLNKLTNATVVNPMVVIENVIRHEEYMLDLMNVIQLMDIRNILNYFTVNTVIDGVKLADLISPVSTNRSGWESFNKVDNYESLTGLEALKENKGGKSTRYHGTEDKDDGDGFNKPKNIYFNNTNKTDDIQADITEYPPLAVGRTILAEKVNSAGVKIKFPLTFKITPISVSTPELIKIFQATSIQTGYKARRLMLKSGEITTPEWFSGSDIVKAKFRARDKEYTNYISEMESKATKSAITFAKTGIFNLNTEANTFIMTSNTLRQLEVLNGFKMTNAGSRQKVFKTVLATRIVVVDPDRGTFTFYYNGIQNVDVFTKNDLKSKSNKASGAESIEALVKLINGR